jgi:SAM-dependent methyltransferase
MMPPMPLPLQSVAAEPSTADPPTVEPSTAEPSTVEPAGFIDRIRAALHAGDFVTLVLAKPVASGAAKRVEVRRVVLRGAEQLCLLSRFATRDDTCNLPVDAGLQRIDDLLRGAFRHAVLHTQRHEVSLLIGKRGQRRVLERALVQPREVPPREHDRAKQRWLTLDRPFLTELGVTDAQRRLIPAMARKWRQINKFIEVFDAAWRHAGFADDAAPTVVDFGSGKGYLTFALHDHLRNGRGLAAQVRGVELRADMVALCNGAVARLGIEGLAFEQGDVRDARADAADVVIALHACDTATDHAIHLGVRAGARIILCAPCCHKEVRPQLLSPQPLRAILQHGVHLGQEAEMVTDGLRALLLEACGYATQVFEFISLEHTSKNKMILAVKREHPAAAAPALEQVDEVKRFYGIRDQCLERLLRERLGALPA